MKNKIVSVYLDTVATLEREYSTQDSKRFLEDMKHHQEMIEAARDDFTCITNLCDRLLKSSSIEVREYVLLCVFNYLLAAEGVVCNFLNQLTYIMVVNGHDLFSLTKRKYVKSDMKEVMKVEMSTKIKFLNHHGFQLLTKEYDSTFRNDIAHHNYLIDEEGIVRIRGKPVDLHFKFNSTTKIINFATETIREINQELSKRTALLEKKLKRKQ